MNIIHTGKYESLVREALDDPDENSKAFLAVYVLQLETLERIATSLEKITASVGPDPYNGDTLLGKLQGILQSLTKNY